MRTIVEPTDASARRGKRIVLTTYGSFGDLHPYVAIALGLRERGHDAILATSECYRRKVEALGLGFHAIRPDSDWVSNPDEMRRLMGLRTGLVKVVTEKFLPACARPTRTRSRRPTARSCSYRTRSPPTPRGSWPSGRASRGRPR